MPPPPNDNVSKNAAATVATTNAKGGTAALTAAERRRSNVVKEVERLKENRNVVHFMILFDSIIRQITKNCNLKHKK